MQLNEIAVKLLKDYDGSGLDLRTEWMSVVRAAKVLFLDNARPSTRGLPYHQVCKNLDSAVLITLDTMRDMPDMSIKELALVFENHFQSELNESLEIYEKYLREQALPF